MRVGIVTFWFNRGQASVGRHLRDALIHLGHQVSILARPSQAGDGPASSTELTDVWRVPDVTMASANEVPLAEYTRFTENRRLDACFFFQNYQFTEIAEVRRRGVRTFGTFMREDFGATHVDGAMAAFDTVYSLTPSDRERFAQLGVDAPLVPWGCHPETLAVSGGSHDEDVVRFLFPGGHLTQRKPVLSVLDAFSLVASPRARLVIKAQRLPLPAPLSVRTAVHAAAGRLTRGLRAARATPDGDQRPTTVSGANIGALMDRIESDARTSLLLGDIPAADHAELLRRSDVCLAPARWEGLGLHLYEATGAGLPIVANDMPPITDVVTHKRNGLLARSWPSGTRPSGVPIHDVDIESLAEMMTQAVDDDTRRDLAAGARQRRGELSWDHTVQALRDLLRGTSGSD